MGTEDTGIGESNGIDTPDTPVATKKRVPGITTTDLVVKLSQGDRPAGATLRGLAEGTLSREERLPDLSAQNRDLLHNAGQVGEAIIPYYEYALRIEPSLQTVRLIRDDDSMPISGRNFADGRHAIKIPLRDTSPQDILDNMSMGNRIVIAERFGTTPAELAQRPDLLYAFGAIHELGHTLLFQQYESDPGAYVARSKQEIDHLPVPGEHLTDKLKTALRDENSRQSIWVREHWEELQNRWGAQNIEELIDVQSIEKRKMFHEQFADDFAIRILQGVAQERASLNQAASTTQEVKKPEVQSEPEWYNDGISRTVVEYEEDGTHNVAYDHNGDTIVLQHEANRIFNNPKGQIAGDSIYRLRGQAETTELLVDYYIDSETGVIMIDDDPANPDPGKKFRRARLSKPPSQITLGEPLQLSVKGKGSIIPLPHLRVTSALLLADYPENQELSQRNGETSPTLNRHLSKVLPEKRSEGQGVQRVKKSASNPIITHYPKFVEADAELTHKGL